MPTAPSQRRKRRILLIKVQGLVSIRVEVAIVSGLADFPGPLIGQWVPNREPGPRSAIWPRDRGVTKSFCSLFYWPCWEKVLIRIMTRWLMLCAHWTGEVHQCNGNNANYLGMHHSGSHQVQPSRVASPLHDKIE